MKTIDKHHMVKKTIEIKQFLVNSSTHPGLTERPLLIDDEDADEDEDEHEDKDEDELNNNDDTFSH